MLTVKLVNPEKKHHEMVEDFIVEFFKYKSSFHGFDRLIETASYQDWLTYIEKQKNENQIEESRVAAESLFATSKEEDIIIGIVNIRYRLNEYLNNFGGHIGISIRPKYRNKGLGTEVLRLTLDRCKELNIEKVLITCNKSNQPSAKMIKKNGGVLAGEIIEEDGNIIQRYWIENK